MNDLTLGLLGIYVVIGVVVAGWLVRRGTSAPLALSALVCWPLLLPGGARARTPSPSRSASPSPSPSGPLRAAIDQAFAKLDEALADAPELGGAWRDELRTLEACLVRADARLAIADRMLAEPAADGLDASTAALAERRAHTAREVGAVLAEVGRLRLALGLRLLAPAAGVGASAGPSLREALDQLLARVAALDEVDRGPCVR